MSVSFDPKESEVVDDKAKNQSEGGFIMHGDAGAVYGGLGIEAEVSQSNLCDNKYTTTAKIGGDVAFLWLAANKDLGLQTDPETGNWEPLQEPSNWQETKPENELFKGELIPKIIGLGAFAGWFIGKQ